MNFHVVPFEQPAGMFYLTSMSASQLIGISIADPRKYDPATMTTSGWIQREKSPKRVREIAEYAETIDAAFPTAILLAIESPNYSLSDDESEIKIEGEKVAKIVDGQHRVEGLKLAQNIDAFRVPVVLMLDATIEQQALIFATINGKQTKVPSSLIYELFDVTTTRSPQKTAHEIARAMNGTESSPWFTRLKMLGRKTAGSIESLSQGTFVKFLLPEISDKPEIDRDLVKRGEPAPERSGCVFNGYWRGNKDDVILKILMNAFQGAKATWPKEWQMPDNYILTKTNGFTGIMKALPEMVTAGTKGKDLSADYFSRIFTGVKGHLERDRIELTSQYFPTSAVGEAKFRDYILRNLPTR